MVRFTYYYNTSKNFISENRKFVFFKIGLQRYMLFFIPANISLKVFNNQRKLLFQPLFFLHLKVTLRSKRLQKYSTF
ncbi:MAG: hypothetical protein EA392_08530 [Cryomorphaceae bacterium]|nr:MAG: hypothetical protein EA392_08530 [Cryomorphaceae bacterium]